MDIFKWDRVRGTGIGTSTEGEEEDTKETIPNQIKLTEIPSVDELRGGEADVTDIIPILSHDLKLESASGYLPYTNFVAGFQDILDYIFITRDTLYVEDVAPMPTYEDLTEYTALPSVGYPSDHVAIAVDLTFSSC